MKQLIDSHNKILMEAAVVERLRRSSDIELHPKLLNAPLIYNKQGKAALLGIYQEYVDIAQNSNMPLIVCTPTWRANYLRVISSDVPISINADAVTFLKEFRQKQKNYTDKIKIAGLIGCKNDCYQPDEGLSEAEAQQFHSWQIEQLASGEVDVLIAETLPGADEALGIAKAMEETDIPYIISFVVSKKGQVLDGSSLSDVIDRIDNNTIINPLGYMVNCAFPSFICPEEQPIKLFERLIGCQANASSLEHFELDEAEQLEADSVSGWGRLMLELNTRYGVKILGGCCGTDGEHLRYIANNT